MLITEVIIIALAAGMAVNVWMQPEGIFSGVKERMPDWYLFSCRFCLTCQVSIAFSLIFLLPKIIFPGIGTAVWFLPVVALAAARISILIGIFTASLGVDDDPENTE